MKKQNGLAEFFKSKSFYALLCVGALAIIAMLLVGLNRSSDNKKDMVDLNEPMTPLVEEVKEGTNVANDTNDTTPSDIANIPSDILAGVAKSDEDGFYVSEERPEDVYQNDALVSSLEPLQETGEAAVPESTTQTAENIQEATETNDTPSAEVMTNTALFFDEESVLSWPVLGNILIGFGRYHDETTRTSRVNEGINISANVGDEVIACTAGKVVRIGEDDRVGTVVEVEIGNGYKLVYGQLDKDSLKVSEGEYVNEGSVIGKVNTRTEFYYSQGNNVYLQLLKNDEPVDPNLYLKEK